MGSSARSIVAMLPTGPGVYRFRDARNRTLYIGRAVSLRRRVASYWGGLGDRPRLSAMVRTIDRVEAVSCDSEHEAAWLERNLLERHIPRWNLTADGQEVAVCIRLDGSASAPGLSVVHTAGKPTADGGLTVDGWRQYRRTSAQARPWLAATPAAWRDFAHRNAVLAARLGGARLGPMS